MNFRAKIVGSLVCLMAPLSARAQSASSAAESYWQPTLRVGAWGPGSAPDGLNEPRFGPIAALELRREDPTRRLNFLVAVGGYSKRAGDLVIDFPVRKEYHQRGDLLMLEVGADLSPLPSVQRWKLGMGVGVATSRAAITEITATGQPYSTGGDGGWKRPTGVLTMRTHYTLPVSRGLGVRFGVEAFQGVEALLERAPNIAAHVGVTLRR